MNRQLYALAHGAVSGLGIWSAGSLTFEYTGDPTLTMLATLVVFIGAACHFTWSGLGRFP